MKKTKDKKKIYKIEQKTYTEELKNKLLKFYEYGDKSIKDTAKDLGIPYSTFASWVKAAGINRKLLDPNLSELERENIRLKCELMNVTEERDILKKGLAILMEK